MYWWYFLILISAVAYFAYRQYMVQKGKKRTSPPRCSKCGSVMELGVKQGDSEVWICPKCNSGKPD